MTSSATAKLGNPIKPPAERQRATLSMCSQARRRGAEQRSAAIDLGERASHVVAVEKRQASAQRMCQDASGSYPKIILQSQLPPELTVDFASSTAFCRS